MVVSDRIVAGNGEDRAGSYIVKVCIYFLSRKDVGEAEVGRVVRGRSEDEKTKNVHTPLPSPPYRFFCLRITYRILYVKCLARGRASRATARRVGG
jgi:hypothetical protein